jgi:hypothetical protein
VQSKQPVFVAERKGFAFYSKRLLASFWVFLKGIMQSWNAENVIPALNGLRNLILKSKKDSKKRPILERFYKVFDKN